MSRPFVVIGCVLIAVSSSADTASDDSLRNAALRFVEVLTNINKSYVDLVNPERLVDDALFGMLSKLDPHTVYLSPDRSVELAEKARGSYTGAGLDVAFVDGEVFVVGVAERGPSVDADICPFDRIDAIDGVSTSNLSEVEVRGLLRGESGSTVELSLVSYNGEQKIVTLTRGDVEVPSIPAVFLIDDRVGYIRVRSFSRRTADELDSALAVLSSGGARSVILDLRGNMGGIMSAGVGVASRFLPESTIVAGVTGRETDAFGDFVAGPTPMKIEWPVVVLVDRKTGSASEIVAGALQDHDRALVVGERTFGKGLVQGDIPLSNGGRLILTIGRYTTPLGRVIQRPFTKGEFDDYYGSPSLGDTTDVYVTSGGRVLHGGGGIVPDVLFKSSLQHPGGWNGRFDEAAFNVARSYGSNQQRPKNVSELVSNVDRGDLIAAFAAELSLRGLSVVASEREAVHDKAVRSIVVQVSRSFWGEDGAAEAALLLDPILPVALDSIEVAERLAGRKDAG